VSRIIQEWPASPAYAEVDLGHRIESYLVQQVDHYGHLRCVTREERYGTKQLARSGELSGEWLQESGQFRTVQVKERTRH
jgi:hypothetical protein